MNYSQLRAFHMVAKEGSFTKGARALHVSQPTLSAQVKELEETYGLRLFDRRGRGAHMTTMGVMLQNITNRLFDLEGEAEILLSGAKDLTRGYLSVGADSPFHAMPILSELKKQYPNLRLSLSMGNADDMLQELLEYKTDVAILAKKPKSKKIYYIPYKTENLMAFMPKGHILAKNNYINLNMLQGEDMVLREVGSVTREVLSEALNKINIKTGAIIEIQSREAVREAVLAGLGIGVVFANEFGNDPNLIALPIKQPELLVGEYVVCLQDRMRLANIKAFLKIAKTTIMEAEKQSIKQQHHNKISHSYIK